MISKKLKSKVLSMSEKMLKDNDSTNKHFSFLVKRNTIVSVGRNYYFRTHPISKILGYRFDSCHSELQCILNYKGDVSDLPKLTLVNVRINRFKQLGMSKPCAKCMRLLEQVGLRRVVYTDFNGEFRKLEY